MAPKDKDNKKKQKVSVSFPTARVSAIMRRCSDIAALSNDAVVLTARAAELFMARLAETALTESTDRKSIKYNDIARIVHEDPLFAFLKDIVPKKVTVKRYKRLLNEIEQQERELGRTIKYEIEEVL